MLWGLTRPPPAWTQLVTQGLYRVVGVVGKITGTLISSKSGGEFERIGVVIEVIDGVLGPDTGDDLKFGEVIGDSLSPPIIRILGRGFG